MAILNPKYEFLKADYMNPNLVGNLVEPTEEVIKFEWTVPKILMATAPGMILTVPSVAFAAGGFDNLYPTLMRLFDSAVVLVIVFAGATWAMGHRPKAIELLIGVCCGYLLARNAVNIRDFLKTI